MSQIPPPSKSLLRAILDNAVDAIITIDQQGSIRSVNPATTRMFDYRPGDLIGKNVNLLMPSPFREEHNEYLAKYMSSGRPRIIGFGREAIGCRSDGTQFPIHLAVSEIRVEHETLFVGIVRDISDVKEAELMLADINKTLERQVKHRTAELRAAQAELLQKEKLVLLGQVSANISHEIRNPLNAVKTSAYYLLNAKSPEPEKIAEHLERIDRQIRLIDNVITSLADLTRLPEPKLTDIESGPWLREVVPSVPMPRNIDVVIDVAEAAPSFRGDVNQLSIVIRNLIRNARDAMPEGGTLTVSAHPCSDRVEITVRDTGVGIDSAALLRVTEPFFSTKARGMGLGLAIVRAILEKNQAEMNIETEPGAGSAFQLQFPQSAPRDD